MWLVLKSISKTIAVIAIIGLKRFGECIGFGFENDTPCITIIEQFKEACRTVIGWNKQHFLWWLLRLFNGAVFAFKG